MQDLLTDAIASNSTEPSIVRQFTEKVGVIRGAFDGCGVEIRSKFIHQRPYALFVEPPIIEGKVKTELGDILFVVKEKIGGKLTRRRMVILQVKIAEPNGRCAVPPHQHAFQRDLYRIAFRFGNRYYADRWHPIIWSHLSKSGRLMANLVLHREKGNSPVICYARDFERYPKLDFRVSWFTRFSDYFTAFCSFEPKTGVVIADPLDTMLGIIYRSEPVKWDSDPPEEWQEYFGEAGPDGGFGVVEITISRDGRGAVQTNEA